MVEFEDVGELDGQGGAGAWIYPPPAPSLKGGEEDEGAGSEGDSAGKRSGKAFGGGWKDGDEGYGGDEEAKEVDVEEAAGFADVFEG